MADKISVFDPYGYLGLLRNPDGSVSRVHEFPFTPAATDLLHPSLVLTKDVPINQSTNTWARIYLPRQALDNSPPAKLPLLVYYHGGGFVVCTAGSTIVHDFVAVVAAETNSVIVSVEYRRAPEHRLPAAYDDCFEALHWIKTSPDEWLTRFADFSNCFLMGTSAGGNITYFMGLRAAAAVADLEPLRIRGLIFHHAFYGGTKRTASEMRLSGDKIVPLSLNATDLMWELALPAGADRDHQYSNPMAGGDWEIIDEIRKLGWKVLTTGYEGDPLIDRQIEQANVLEEKGVKVVRWFCEGGYHGLEAVEPSKAKPLCEVLKDFISSSSSFAC
ncbi:probable carboxylesterase 120 [Diospyros lotus]|uniref:probable carboxylesterase 120 n=1 Tax=Diospyros lotus TaxID=55363 RepID=UPI002251C30A|nr:probable carboxylesterase 120 [Diospyros lotus]